MALVKLRVVGILLLVSLSSSIVLWWITPPINQSALTNDVHGRSKHIELEGMVNIYRKNSNIDLEFSKGIDTSYQII